MLIGINPYRYEAASGDTPILDQLSTSAFAAYSMRLTRAAYTGDCIEVRNNSGTLLDIGFVDGYLDTSALTTHLGGSAGTIATWYDQSGNGYDLSNSTAAEQPVIDTGQFSGHSALYCANMDTARNLHSASLGSIIGQNELDIYAVGYKDSTAYATVYCATQTLGSFASSYIAMIHTSTNARGYIGGVNNTATVTLNGEAWWNRIHRTGAMQDNENEIYIESTGATTTSSATNGATESDTVFLMMGMERESPTSSGYSGDILEVIHFNDGVLSTDDSDTLEADQKTYYNL